MDSDRSMEPLSHSEMEEWITDLGIHEEGLESPAPSCFSMKSGWSMDQPLHFKRESWTPEFRVKHQRVESPAPRCFSMKSDWSIDQPLHFKREGLTPGLRVKQERVESPAPSCLSVKSDLSMEPPLHFKRESWTPEFSEFSSSLLSKDHFRCSVCSEGLREPVSIACGHSYCRQCISTYWARPSHAGDYQCPQCSKSFPTRPELYKNTDLVRVLQALQQAGFSPVLPAVAHAGPGDVACDICCGPKVRAVKTCVTCSASYCKSHVRQHYTVPALQRHTLTQVTGDQRHTHQQDSVKKMEIIKKEVSLKQQKEEEETGQSPKMGKMQLKVEEDASDGSSDELKKRDRELELENSELKNICSKLSDKTAPSCVFMKSDESMEPPLHFGLEETIIGSGIHEEGLESRPPSRVSMKSDWSMDPPLHFKQEGLTPELRVKQERVESPAPSFLSVKSDRSMDPPPLHFKRESWTPEFSEFSSSLLSEDHFRCSVCSEGLKEPVSIPCGHSYCRQCISTYWAQPSHAGDYQCPQCSESFPTRPKLSTNTALVRVLQALQQAGFSPVLPAVAHAGSGDVACDICCGPKPRAVKTCVTCSASYCESHVRQHYTVPALQRHTLTHVTGDQRHTHQQDRVIKMEIIKKEVLLKRQREEEEMEDRGQTPKMGKMQLKVEEDASKGSSDEELELENAELKNICSKQNDNTAETKDKLINSGMGGSSNLLAETLQQGGQQMGPGGQAGMRTQQPGALNKDYDLCIACYNTKGHEHKMEKLGLGLDDESNNAAAAATQSPGDSRRLSIQRCIQSLVHACQCRNANCSLPSCQKMKRVVQHAKGCKRKTNGGCPICKQLIALCCYHAKHCQENKCPVPFCLNIKHKLRQQQLQHRLEQAPDAAQEAG